MRLADLADAALDTTAHVGERYPDDVDVLAFVITLVLQDEDNTITTYTHTTTD